MLTLFLWTTIDGFRICHCFGPSIASAHFSIGTCQSCTVYIWLPLHLRLTIFIEIVNKIWQVTPEIGACLEETLNNFCMSLFAGQLQGGSSIVLRIDRSSRVDQEVYQVQMSLLTGQLQRASSETACDVNVRISRLRQASHPHWNDNTKAPSTFCFSHTGFKTCPLLQLPSYHLRAYWLKVSLSLRHAKPQDQFQMTLLGSQLHRRSPKSPFLVDLRTAAEQDACRLQVPMFTCLAQQIITEKNGNPGGTIT